MGRYQNLCGLLAVFDDEVIALYRLDPDWWIELESTYRERIQQRIEIYELHGKKVADCLPQARAAFEELVEMVIQYVTVR